MAPAPFLINYRRTNKGYKMPASNRATGKPIPQHGDKTAVEAQALEQKKLEDEKQAKAEAAELADVEAYEKKNIVTDYYTNCDVPLAEIKEDEVTSTLPYREVTIKYGIENMVFGRKVIREPEYAKDDKGNDTWEIIRPAELGGLKFFSFEEGRRYKLPRELADHLDEHGYIFH